jgi:hypothetical protein
MKPISKIIIEMIFILAEFPEIPNDDSCSQCHMEAASSDYSVDGRPSISLAPYATVF